MQSEERIMGANAEVAKLQEEAANVLARLIIVRDEVIRIGVMDVIVDDRLCWKFLLVFVKDQDTVRTYLDELGEQAARKGDIDIDFTGSARFLLLPWVDIDDMMGWLDANWQAVFAIKSTPSGPMNIDAWASQLATIEMIIVPGAGMDINPYFTVLDFADIHRNSRAPIGDIVSSIYEAAYEGRDGLNAQAILGPRPGVRFFNPTTKRFET